MNLKYVVWDYFFSLLYFTTLLIVGVDMDIQLNRPVVFIDVESTGVSPPSDKIVELTALKIFPDKSEEILSTRINPGVPIPPEATAIHGITDADIQDKPTFKQYAPKLIEFLEGCDLGGFNVKRFDIPILESEFRRAGVEFSRQGRHILDVQTIYHKYDPRDLSAAYKKYCGKEMENHHASESDVRATFEILESQLKQYSDLPKTMRELHDFCNERRNPNWLDEEGKFVWVGEEVVINFGPHRGKSLSYLVENESGFLGWMISKDFLPDAKKIASDALKGEFPKKE